MLNKLCTTIIFVLFFGTYTTASDTSSFYHFTTENGLPSNNVYSVIKDKCGFIWIATDNGVAKYDGYSFRIFTTNDGLPSNDVWKLYEDNNGRIWLYSNTTKIGYIKNDKYYSFTLKKGDVNPSFIISIGATVLIVYINHGLHNLSLFMNGDIITIPIQRFSISKNELIRITAISTDKIIWILTSKNRFIRIKTSPLSIASCDANQETYHLMARTSHITPGADFFYFYTTGISQLYLYNSNKERLFQSDLFKKKLGAITASYYEKGVLGIVAEKGFCKIKGDRFIACEYYSIPSNSRVNYVAEIYDNWYCTLSDGVWVKKVNSIVKSNCFINKKLNNATYVGQFNNASYWWQTSTNTLLTIDGNHTRKTDISPELGTIRQVCQTSKKEFFLSNKGVYTRDKTGNSYTSFAEKKPLILGAYMIPGLHNHTPLKPSQASAFYCIFSYVTNVSDTSFLVNTRRSFDLLTEKKEYFEAACLIRIKITDATKIKSLEQFSIYNEQNIYLYSYDFKKKVHFASDILNNLGISNIQKIMEIPNGHVYILTNEQLLRYVPGKSISTIPTGLNLSGADLTFAKNHLVITGALGVAYADISDHRFSTLINFKKESYNKVVSTAIDSNARLYLATDKHVFTLELDSFFRHPNQISTNYNPTHFVSNVRYTSLTLQDTIILTPEDNKLSVTPVNQMGAGKPLIKYSVNNSSTWQEATANEFDISDIKPDRFYKIRYYLQDDFWKSPVHTLYVKKLPLWYQKTEWKFVFIASGLLFFAGSIFIGIRIGQRVAVKNTEKKRLQTELELRAIHSQINPHFIFNTLSTALFFISRHQTKQAYEHVNSFSKLLRSYLKSSRDRFITLEEEIKILKQYVQLQRARFSKAFDYEIYVAEGIDTEKVLLPSLMLQPLVENAINHGLFNRQENGYLKIEFLKGDNEREIICIIDDNGVGRQHASLLKSRHKKERSSYGTALTKELIDVFKRYEQMNIDLQYIDKQYPDTGTTVKLIIRNVRNSVSL